MDSGDDGGYPMNTKTLPADRLKGLCHKDFQAWIDAKGSLRIWLEDNGLSTEEIPQKYHRYQQAMFDQIK